MGLLKEDELPGATPSHLDKLKEAMDEQFIKSSKIVNSFRGSYKSPADFSSGELSSTPYNTQTHKPLSSSSLSSSAEGTSPNLNFPRLPMQQRPSLDKSDILFQVPVASNITMSHSSRRSFEQSNSPINSSKDLGGHVSPASYSSKENTTANASRGNSTASSVYEPFEGDYLSESRRTHFPDVIDDHYTNLFEFVFLLVSNTNICQLWKNVIDIFTQQYSALELSLIEPCDISDVFNTPWKLKCLYQGSVADTKRNDTNDSEVGNDDIADQSDPFIITASTGAKGIIYFSQRPPHRKSPLLDHYTVQTVLERKAPLVYTRRLPFTSRPSNCDYSYSTERVTNTTVASGDSATSTKNSDISNKASQPFLSANNFHEAPSRYNYCSEWVNSGQANRGMYDEFEQNLLSPWSKSPIGSPAIQAESNRNPFFQGLQEASFSKSDENEENLNDTQNLHKEASNDDLWGQSIAEQDITYSLVHIPIVHPGTDRSSSPSNRIPIAILSFKSNLVPYPENLLSYISRLVPFIFAAYTNCQATMVPSNVPYYNSHDNMQSKLHSTTGAKHGDFCFKSQVTNAHQYPNEERSSNLSEKKLFNLHSLYNRDIKACSKFTANGSSLRTQNFLQRLKRVFDKKRQRFCNYKRYTSEKLPYDKKFSVNKGPNENVLRSNNDFQGRQNLPDDASPPSSLLRSIIDSIPVHVFIADPSNGKVTWVNGRAQLYSGLSINEILTRQFGCIHPDDLQNFMRDWKQFLYSAEAFTKEIRLQRFDGVYRFFIFRAIPLLDCSGSVLHIFGTMTDVHEQKLAESKVQKQSAAAANESNYRSLAEASPQIVFAASTKNGIIYANAQWLSYSGLSLENSLGLGYLSAVHRDDRKKCLLPDPSIDPTSANTYVAEIRFRSTDGYYRWHLVKSVCVNNSADFRSNLWLGTCTDIHDHKMLEEKLKEANVEAHRIVRDKMQYLSNMSHEIRTPLIGITGMVSFLLETELSSEQISYAHVIQQSAESLLTVINDILDLSKVRAGMVKLCSERFSLRAMMEDANETLSTLAFCKGIELNFIIDLNIPDVLFGDRNRIRQVALNVISNAIKFTDMGEVITHCSVEKWLRKEQSVVLKWECIDTGPGFDEVGQSRIFKPFSQIDTSNARKQGSGLGLVISRELAELHGGEMTCKSVKGVGTHFIWTARFKIDNEILNYDIPDGCCPVCFHPYEQSKKINVPNNYKHADNAGKLTSENVGQVNNLFSEDGIKVNTNENSTKLKNSSKISGYHNPFAPAFNFCQCSTSIDPSNILFWKLYRFQSDGILLNYDALVVIVSHTKFSSAALVNSVQTLLDEKTLKDIISFKDTTKAYHQLRETPIKSNVSHIILNLVEIEDYATFLRFFQHCASYRNAIFIVIVNAKQKAALPNLFTRCEIDQSRIYFVLRLVKPSKLFPIFYKDSINRDDNVNRSSQMSEKLAVERKAETEALQNDLKNSKFRVLLAEDNVINIKVFSRYLEKMGVEFNVVMNGLDCFQEWKRNDPNYYSLILMDLQMPVMDGYQACMEIRKHQLENGYKAITIVALSADALSHVATTCEECGFDTYLSKPITLKQLTSVVSNLFYTKI
ncbi:histidine kinase Mak1 [Schizosaccharomyces cryophilus OY26]|uniref:Histidine kinase Mak1 n=1 Tax=Schizosaccharomyces cryophilus (strain OY26 / ATCC MYA-4695 / CBS 11777 / NBRC 106824 / NRRL Y48691) TaxID=653667 RepID=S9VVR2_SCHCR|nr:histidine kinase Mak1 [Schizosaccharomyces cryophilus OY26]EPY50294.1 histidine kinase Mak1 [Schizosaccharomyces cryophilus OY26]